MKPLGYESTQGFPVNVLCKNNLTEFDSKWILCYTKC